MYNIFRLKGDYEQLQLAKAGFPILAPSHYLQLHYQPVNLCCNYIFI